MYLWTIWSTFFFNLNEFNDMNIHHLLFQISYPFLFSLSSSKQSICIVFVLSSKVTYTPWYSLCITATKSINIVTQHTYIFIYKKYYCPLFLIIGQIYCSNFQLLEAIFQHRYKCITKIGSCFFCLSFSVSVEQNKIHFHMTICNISSFILNLFYPAVRSIFLLTVFQGYSS